MVEQEVDLLVVVLWTEDLVVLVVEVVVVMMGLQIPLTEELLDQEIHLL
jgi:hypothetical protein